MPKKMMMMKNSIMIENEYLMLYRLAAACLSSSVLGYGPGLKSLAKPPNAACVFEKDLLPPPNRIDDALKHFCMLSRVATLFICFVYQLVSFFVYSK
jgi:hypothetical protein